MTTRHTATIIALALALLPLHAFAQADMPAIEVGPPPTTIPALLPAPLPDFTLEGPLPTPVPIPAGKGVPLASIRGDQTLTTNAMLGSINSHPVYALDIFRPINSNLQTLATTAKSIGEFRTRARALISAQLDTYKREILLTSAAENTLTQHDQDLIAAVLEKQRINLVSKNGGSIPAADKALAAQGSSVEKEMSDKRRGLIVSLYLEKNISPKIIVTYPMIRDAYERDPKRWQRETQIELYELTLPVVRWLPHAPGANGAQGALLDDPTPAQVTEAENKAMATANEIIARIKKGPDTPQLFATLVDDYDSRDSAASKGGRLSGELKKGSIPDPHLETYVFSLPAHTLGEPQLLRDTKPQLSRVVIVKVGDRTEDHTVPFEEAQATLKNELWLRQSNELQDQYLRKLAETGAIEAVDRMIDVAVDAAVARYATDR